MAGLGAGFLPAQLLNMQPAEPPTSCPTVSEIVAGVSAVLPDLVAAAVWAYVSRTLTDGAAAGVDAVKAVTDRLATMLDPAAGSPGDYAFSADALRNAPTGTGAGASDWTAGERAQIRNRLGIDGASTVPTATPTLATAADVAEVEALVDTEVAAIKAVTDKLGTTLEAAAGSPSDYRFSADSLSAVPVASDAPTAAEVAGAVWDAAVADHLTTGTFGKAMDDTDKRGARTVIRGTAASGTASTLTPSALSVAGAAADQFQGRIILFDLDTVTPELRGQATDIISSTGDALSVLTFSPLTTAPAAGDNFSIV